MLMEIHVIGLDEEQLAFYRRFPGNVVTSICAVDICELSYIQDETSCSEVRSSRSCQFCDFYCRDHGLVEDEAEYQRLLGEKRKELTAMMIHEE